MGLYWNVEQIADYEHVCFRSATEQDAKNDGIAVGDRLLREETERIIWAMVGIGMREINADNWSEVYARLAVMDLLDGIPQRLTPTPETVYKHIGLTTNVTHETRAVWRKRIDRKLDSVAKGAEREIAEMPLDTVSDNP